MLTAVNKALTNDSFEVISLTIIAELVIHDFSVSKI